MKHHQDVELQTGQSGVGQNYGYDADAPMMGCYYRCSITYLMIVVQSFGICLRMDCHDEQWQSAVDIWGVSHL